MEERGSGHKPGAFFHGAALTMHIGKHAYRNGIMRQILTESAMRTRLLFPRTARALCLDLSKERRR